MFTVIIVRVVLILLPHLAVREQMELWQKYVVVERPQQRHVINVNMFIVIIVLVVRIHMHHLVLTEHRERFLKYVVVVRLLEHVINVRLIIAHILVRAGHMNQVQIVVMAHPVLHIKNVDVEQVTLPRLVILVTHLRILTTIIVRPVISVAPEW